MPASIPGDSKAAPSANPSAGKVVLFDLLSGPKNSPLDARLISYAAGANTPTYTNVPTNRSTGGLSTGIGFGCPPVMGASVPPTTAIKQRGFQDDYVPGVTVNTRLTGYVASPDSSIVYIGGGKSGPKSTVKAGIPFPTAPYVAGFGIGAAGAGGSRDATAGPQFTGFTLKTVTAAAGVAVGAAVEAGFLYRGVVGGSLLAAGAEVNLPDLVANQSVFGSNAAASAIPA